MAVDTAVAMAASRASLGCSLFGDQASDRSSINMISRRYSRINRIIDGAEINKFAPVVPSGLLAVSASNSAVPDTV